MAIRQAPTNNRGGFLQGERSRKFMEEGKKNLEITVRRGGEMESWLGGGVCQGVRGVIRGESAPSSREGF